MTTRWRLNPADVVYVGDNAANDFPACRQLGMKSVWFRNEDGLYYNAVETGIEDIKNINNVTQILEKI